MDKQPRKDSDRRKNTSDRRRANLGYGPGGVDRRKNYGDRRKQLGDRRKGWKEKDPQSEEPKEYILNPPKDITLEELIRKIESDDPDRKKTN